MARVDVSWVVCSALAAVGCAAQGGDVGEDAVLAERAAGAKAGGAPEVGRLAQALGAPRLFKYASVHYGGNLVSEDHFPILPDPSADAHATLCSPGYKRSSARAQWNGNGACEFVGWNNPDDLRDCGAQFHVHTNEFWGGGTCQMWIYEERAPAGSCRDDRGLRCGGAGSDRSCYCDEACVYYGDCCLDYYESCE